MIGKTLGHYEVTGELGKGGMGEVYRARDTKLGREVAIKVLPAAFAQDAERVARLEREARMLAALNHPNIAAIYGLEQQDDTHFLVLELVEGDTLADRIKHGVIPVEESLKLALQIAEALEAAHEKGVIHRDLKPANIKVTPDGKVKVLDFGLAKAFSGEQSDVNLSNSPTLSMQATQQGMILGTAGYMSPEQARGETADHRADVWAFGVVLFEVLTGRTMFQGRTVSDVLAGVLARDPEWSALPPNLHPRLRQLLERCLAREVKDRYSGIGDARVDIAAVLEDPGRGTVQPVVETASATQTGMRTILPWAAGAAVLAAVLVWFLRPLPEAETGIVMRFPIPLAEDQPLSTVTRGIGISRDGTQVAFAGNDQIYVRELGEAEARPLTGAAATGGQMQQPTFSPDGESIAFAEFRGVGVGRELKRLPIAGGTPITLVEGVDLRSVSWPTDDTIVFSTGVSIFRIPANGGEPEILIAARDGEIVESPQLLPDGRHVLYSSSASGNWDEAAIYIQSVDSDERTLVWDGGSDARWVESGHVLYANGNDLFALPWDLDRMEPTGGVVGVVAGVLRSTTPAAGADAAHYDVSDNGMLVYVPGANAGGTDRTIQRTLVWVDPADNGREAAVPVPPSGYRMARISPDLTRVALEAGSPSAIYVHNLETGTGGPITFDPDADARSPLWRNDEEILYHSNAVDAQGVYSIPASGGEATLVAATEGGGVFPSSASADGNTLFANDIQGEINVAILDLSDPAGFERIISTIAPPHPEISPDGAWLATVENATGGAGAARIQIRPFPEVSTRRVQVDPRGGRQSHPLFSPDGSELFYMFSQNIVSVDVTYEPDLAVGLNPRTVVGNGPYRYGATSADGGGGRSWDRHPDGRFLMIRADGLLPDADTAAPSGNDQINVIANWFEELVERAPVD